MVQSVNEFGQPVIKRQRMTPPLNERVMLYVRQDNEDVYTPLHVVPPTTIGLLNAVSKRICFIIHMIIRNQHHQNDSITFSTQ